MIDGVLPFAKYRGETSFRSLWRVKRALGTKKLGHTGTLDSFADGLLVVLSGSYTRLVPFITACDKEYIARVSFGVETDTLDPCGSILATGSIPSLRDLEDSLPRFIGSIMQSPPEYSAIHVDGARASDLARKGDPRVLPSRPVTIKKINIVDSALSTGGTCDLLIECSKGTYIRSLARDIARSLGSVAHLSALRRTRVGPFTLDEAYGAELLEPFSELGLLNDETVPTGSSDTGAVESLLRTFTPNLARSVGLTPITIHAERYADFSHGIPLEASWFMLRQDPCVNVEDGNPHPVFHRDMLIGMVRKVDDRLRYDFVSGNLP